MEAIFAQVIDIPIEYIFNALITVAGGGILIQFKSVIQQLKDLAAKTSQLQLDVTEIKAWMKFKDKQDEREKE